MLGLAIKRATPPGTGLPVFHFAPEEAIGDILIERFGKAYTPADIAPEQYPLSKVPVMKVDLSTPSYFFKPDSVQGFVHSHVLEHIPGSIERIVGEMNEAIAPGGFHLFQVPVDKGWYREDMDPNMTPRERLTRFAQEDHMRVFGTEDFEDRCLRLFRGFRRVNLRRAISRDEAIKAAVPVSALTSLTGHTPFLFVKD